MTEPNLQKQFEQLEMFFEECRQQREERKPVPSRMATSRSKEVVELVPWPKHMRFD